MSIAHLPSGDIFYQLTGPSEKRVNSPIETLVLIGGLSGDHHIWDLLVPLLTDHYQVLVFDNPGGCGRSYLPNKNFTMQDFASTVIELCDHLAIEQAYFVGNSMGGAIVQELAYRFKDRVKKAVIANSFEKTSQLAFMHFAKAGLGFYDGSIPEKDFVRANLAWGFSGRFLSDQAMVEQLIDTAINSPNKQSKAGYELQVAALDSFDASMWLSKIEVPCLFFASDEDAIVFPGQIKAMSSKVKNSQFYLFESSVGHLPHIERPELFVEKLFEFLEFD